MKKISIYIVSLLLLASCNGETLIDKNLLEKSYDTSLQSLDLRDLSLAMIPDFSVFGTGTSFENAQSIDLSGNDIEFLEIDKLAYFEGLREIYLADNEIKVVNNLDINADILDLSDNRIETAFFQS
jgi:Leucine-rich repeat (LRR) protein